MARRYRPNSAIYYCGIINFIYVPTNLRTLDEGP